MAVMEKMVESINDAIKEHQAAGIYEQEIMLNKSTEIWEH